jgi:hypothetical protein
MTKSPKTSPQAPEALVAGHDDRAPLLASADELSALAIDRDAADRADDQDLGLPEELQLLVHVTFRERLAEARGPGGRREEGAVPLLAGRTSRNRYADPLPGLNEIEVAAPVLGPVGRCVP